MKKIKAGMLIIFFILIYPFFTTKTAQAPPRLKTQSDVYDLLDSAYKTGKMVAKRDLQLVAKYQKLTAILWELKIYSELLKNAK